MDIISLMCPYAWLLRMNYKLITVIVLMDMDNQEVEF